MDLEIIEKMDAPELRKYIEFLLWHYRVVDAFWYLYITEQFDQDTADRSAGRRQSECASYSVSGQILQSGKIDRAD